MKSSAILQTLSLLAPFSSAESHGPQVHQPQPHTNGYQIHDEETLGLDAFPGACQNALTSAVQCDELTKEWTHHQYHGILNEGDDIEAVCDHGCLQSIADWRKAVSNYCDGYEWEGGAAPDILGSFISYGLDETCQEEQGTGKNCNDIILDFSEGDGVEEMPDEELCSSCFLDRLKMMQASPYSVYRQVAFYQDALQAAVKRCGLSGQPTATKDSPFPSSTPDDVMCLSGVRHTTVAGNTCDSLASKYKVSSAAIFSGNPDILDCYDMVTGISVCIPLSCAIYKLREGDTCSDVDYKTGTSRRSLQRLNPWIKRDCSNLQSARETLGRVLCVSEPGGKYDFKSTSERSNLAYSEYAPEVVEPPADAVVAMDTTMRCGRWHRAEQGDECGNVLSRHHISLVLFRLANPSVSYENCTRSLVPDLTYCVGPTVNFQSPEPQIPEFYRYGCFANDTVVANKSVLQYGNVMHKQSMSQLLCWAYCRRESHYSVFGLTNGNTCLCDHRLRMGSIRLNDEKCGMKCNGNSSTTCGGEGAVEVFSSQDTLPVESRSLGCFASTDARPILPDGESVEDKDGMTVEKCGSLCTVGNYIFFALSEGSICTCGGEMAETAKTVEGTNCLLDCSDRRGDYCGGRGFAEVYTTQPIKNGA